MMGRGKKGLLLAAYLGSKLVGPEKLPEGDYNQVLKVVMPQEPTSQLN